MRLIRKKIMAIFLSAAMIVTIAPFSAPQTAYAADPVPEDIQDTYEIDGVTYYNTYSNTFATDKYQFYKDLLLRGSTELKSGEYERSMSDLWLEVGAGLMYGKEPMSGTYSIVFDRAARADEDNLYYINSTTVGDQGFDFEKFPRQTDPLQTDDMKSLKKAEEWVYTVTGMRNPGSNGYFKNEDTENLVVPVAVKARRNDGNSDYRVEAVYFDNFRVVPLLPEDAGNNYVTVENVDTKTSSSISSTVRNNTAATVTGSQEVSSSYTASAQNTTGGSFTHSYQEAFTIGNEFASSPRFFNAFKLEFAFTFKQIVESNWSETTATTESDSTSRSVAVELPPYTSVLLTQKTTDAEARTLYNCPIGIVFDATIVVYSNNQVYQANPVFFPDDATYGTSMVFRYASTARSALESRYKEYGSDPNARPDPDGVLWRSVTAYDTGYDLLIGDAIQKASSYVPMSPTGGEFTQKLHMVASEVDGLLPTLPLAYVMLDPMSVPLIHNTGSYDDHNFLIMKMPVGESTYTGYFKLSGYNAKAMPFYGFSRAFGHWEVVNEAEQPWTGDDAPVRMYQETSNAFPTITAVRPGVCYLKYFIDENTYNTADDLDHFTTNDKLIGTAIIRIEVPDDRTIEVDGQFDGYVDEEPEALDGEGKLRAMVCDATGKEVNEDVTVTWEAKEKTGISVTGGNMVSFTRPGSYHVRACLGDIKSGWVEITAERKHVLTLVPRVEPTCEQNGAEEHYVCEDCGKLFADADAKNELTEEAIVIPASHKLVRIPSMAATCTALGHEEHYICSECGGYFLDKDGNKETSKRRILRDALGHDWSDWETETEPTEEEQGLQYRYCLNDPSHVETRSVPVLGHEHDLVRISKKNPTCTEAGNILYYTCKDCGWVFTDEWGDVEIDPLDTVLPVTAHKWDTGKVTKKPTTTARGEKTYTCTVCGKKKTAAVAKLAKKANPLKVSARTAKVKYSKLKKKSQKLTATKVIKFTKKGQGQMTYTLSSAKKGSRSFNKYFSINKKTGKVTVRKGLKKGTYKVKVKVKAAGNANYKPSAVKTVTFKVKVK